MSRALPGRLTRLAILTSSLAACTSAAGQQRSPEGADSALADATLQPSAPAAPAVVCSDEQLAAVLQAANETEVTRAQTVRDRLTSPEAVALEEKLLTDHALLLAMVQGGERAARIAPADNGVARALASMARADAPALGTLSGGDLDRAYVGREVLAHLEALALLARALPPGLANDRLGYVVESMRDLETQHQAAAMAAEQSLEGACAAADDP
jgi:predicted outer membrane protein